jgi:hypothetical protein
MTQTPYCGWLVLAGAVICAPALAQMSGAAEREMRARLEALAVPELKLLYLGCDDEAQRRVLGFEEAARCSTAAELLKQRGFGGNFDALLAWWKQQRAQERGRMAGG